MELSEALLCLTLAIFKESEGESFKGKKWVGEAVINRVNSKAFPNDVCKVVLEPKQFSWANRMRERNIFGLIGHQNLVLNQISYSSTRLKAYKDSERLARQMLEPTYKTSHRFVYFHSGSYTPPHAVGKTMYIVGNHFYY